MRRGSEPRGQDSDLFEISGAGGRTRTDDLLITNQLLYQLSYAGRFARSNALRAP